MIERFAGLPADGQPGSRAGGEPTPRMQRWTSTRRVAVFSLAVIAVIAGAIAITTWRYEAALTQSSDAIDTLTDAQAAEKLIADFSQERLAMYSYLVTPTTAGLAAVSKWHGQFVRAAQQLPSRVGGPDESPAAVQARAHSAAGQARYYAAFG